MTKSPTEGAVPKAWTRTQAFDDAAAECIRCAIETQHADDISEGERAGYRAACNILAMTFRVMASRAAPPEATPPQAKVETGAGKSEVGVIGAEKPNLAKGQDSRELLIAALAEAYDAGATAVHEEWLKERVLPLGDPEFAEAASDYAVNAVDPLWSNSNVNVAALLTVTPSPSEGRDGERLARRLAGFRESVNAVPYIAERLAMGQQFNAFDSSLNDEDDADEDCTMHVCIGPITDTRSIVTVEGRAQANMIADALTFAALSTPVAIKGRSASRTSLRHLTGEKNHG